jgi:predicted metal-binding membrane protein
LQRPLHYAAAWRDRGTLVTAAALLVITTAAWIALVLPALTADASMTGMDTSADGSASGMTGFEQPSAFAPSLDPVGAATFVGAWLVMMTAMMLPSAAPMILLARALATGSSLRKAAHTAVFVSGYLLVWGGFGLLVYIAQQAAASVAMALPDVREGWPFIVAAVVAAAGIYQFTPLKELCLRQCRSPLSFLMERWRPGIVGGLRLGVRHGGYCLGCCWALMAVLVAAGAMGLAWVTLIALVVFAEKLIPGGRTSRRLVGISLVALAVAILLRPEMAAQLPA